MHTVQNMSFPFSSSQKKSSSHFSQNRFFFFGGSHVVFSSVTFFFFLFIGVELEDDLACFCFGFGFGRFVEFDDEVLSKFSEFFSVEWHGWSWSRPPYSSATFVVEVEDSFITMSASVWLRVFVLESHCIKLMIPMQSRVVEANTWGSSVRKTLIRRIQRSLQIS